MADLMRTLGVGSRLSIFALTVALLAGASGCSREANASSEGAAPKAEAASGEPEQVVHHIVGEAVVAKAAEAGMAAMREPNQARASADGLPRAKGDSLAPRSNAAETITSKHLEAELNRLEAELAN
jgi:hypothetical protein